MWQGEGRGLKIYRSAEAPASKGVQGQGQNQVRNFGMTMAFLKPDLVFDLDSDVDLDVDCISSNRAALREYPDDRGAR